MKREIESLKSGQRRMMLAIANMQGDMAEVKDLVKTILPKLVTRDEFITRMDCFVADVEGARWDRALMSDLYMAHERRLARLEERS